MAYAKDSTYDEIERYAQQGAGQLYGLIENSLNWNTTRIEAWKDANDVLRLDSEQAAYYNGTGSEVLETTGTAQAGTSTTITLASGESSNDDEYVQVDGGQTNQGMKIYIVSGTGSGQNKRITDYVGSTKVATVDSAWTTTPDSTSVYEIYAVAIDDGKDGFGTKPGRTKDDMLSMKQAFTYLTQLDDFLNNGTVTTLNRANILGEWIR